MSFKNQTHPKKISFFSKKRFLTTKKFSSKQKQQERRKGILKREKYQKQHNDSTHDNNSTIPVYYGEGCQPIQYRAEKKINLPDISSKSSFGYDISDKKIIVGNNPRYVTMERIGDGSFSEVFRCFDRQLQIMVAIKKQPLNSETISLIAREVAVMKALSSEIASLHEGSTYIVKCLDSFIDGQLKAHYIVMEYTDFGDLYSFVTSNRYYTTKAQKEMFIKKVLYEVGLGLKFMHGLKVAHRDIKLENILLFPVTNCSKTNSEGKYLTSMEPDSFICKITDFGFATYFDEDNGSNVSMGSLSYAAPELCIREIHSYTLPDVWALGVCLYSALTESHPFTTGQETAEQFKRDMQRILRLQMLYPAELLKYSATFTRLFKRIFVIQANRPPISQILAEFNYWFVDNDMIIRHWAAKRQTRNTNKRRTSTSSSCVSSNHRNVTTNNKTHKRSLSEEKQEHRKFDEHLILSLSWPNSLDDEKKRAQMRKYSDNNNNNVIDLIKYKSLKTIQIVGRNKNISDQINIDSYPFTHSSQNSSKITVSSFSSNNKQSNISSIISSTSSSSSSSFEDKDVKLMENYIEFYMNDSEVTNTNYDDNNQYQINYKEEINKLTKRIDQKITSENTEVKKSYSKATTNQSFILPKLNMKQLSNNSSTGNRYCTTDVRTKTNQKANDIECINLNSDVPTSEPKRKTTGSSIKKKPIPEKNLSVNRCKKRKTRKKTKKTTKK